MERDRSSQPLNTYVSRVIPLAADDATTAFDIWRHDLTANNGRAAAHWGLRRLPASLTLHTTAEPCLGALRRAAGDLIVGRPRVPFPVEVELMPWGAGATELGVRACGRRGRRLLAGGWAADRYFGAAHALAEELTDAFTLLARLPVADKQPAPVARPTVRPHLRLVRYGDC